MPEKLWVQKWQNVSVDTAEREVQIENWLGPDWKAHFRNKTVIDAGCGDGANALHIMNAGAKSIHLIDQNDIVINAAKKRLGNMAVTSMALDLDKANITKKADVVVCLGVLHHLTNRQQVLKKLWRSVKPNGELLVWVYGNYKHGLLMNTLFAIRKVTKRLPFFSNQILAHPLSAALICMAYLHPSKYLTQIRKFSYAHVYEIVLDQMIPKTAVYYDEKRLKSLIGDMLLSYRKDRNEAGWLIYGKKDQKIRVF